VRPGLECTGHLCGAAAGGKQRRYACSPAAQGAAGAQCHAAAGKSPELGSLALDYGDATEFHRRVCEAARAIPAGQTLSYGELAAKLGQPGAARAVGSVMARNALPIIVPCHRVMAAGGRAGGFSAHGGINTKLRMLRIEGARVADQPQAELAFRG